MTYKEALEISEKALSEAGIKEFKNDALLLLQFVTGQDRTFFLTYGDSASLSEDEEERLKDAVKKRSLRTPLQFITGSVSFMGLDFKTAPGVLIPRIDTEFLTEEALIAVNDGAEILDLCTGSGCILLSIMKYKNDIKGTGSDISPEALALARENAELLGINNLELIESDLFNDIEGQFDLIISNPPYIRSAEIPSLMEEVRDFDPIAALDGGEDGLTFYRKIAEGAKDHLYYGASLMFEIGFDQGNEVHDILEKEGYKNISILKDFSGNERVVKCLKA